MKKNNAIKKSLLILIMFILIIPSIHAETITQFCTGPGGVINPKNTFLTLAPNAPNALLKMTVLIILVMITVVGFLYALAYGLGIEKLLIFTRAEIGEIILTGIVAFVFLTAMSMLGSTSTSASGGITNIYGSDCISLTTSSLGLISPLVQMSLSQLIIKIFSSITVRIYPNWEGITFSPFAGFGIISTPLNYGITISGMLIMLLFGMSIILGIIYAFFPIFLYIGIVLRAVPWTRAAGGAFLGLFAGLYIMFPIMLYFGLMGPAAFQCLASTSSASTASTSSACPNSAASALSQVNSNFQASKVSSVNSGINIFTSIINTINGVIAPFGFITTYILEPVLYTLIIYIFSLIIAFNFMEQVGDLLGAPSLSSEHALKNVI